MKIFATTACAVLTAAFLVGAAAAQDMRTEQVHFQAGATGTSIRDSLIGREMVLYEIGAEAGQQMNISLSSDNDATYFNVYAPGAGPGDQALAVGSMPGPMMPDLNQFDGALPTSGVYKVSVYLYRNAARRDEKTNYTLDISVAGATSGTVTGDFADGLAGGPDYYRVATSDGGTLNLRASPSAGGNVVARIANGANLRNLGCRMSEGRRWCNVATLADPGDEGWVAGDFLVEGTAQGSGSTVAPVTSGDVQVRFAAGTNGANYSGVMEPGDSRRFTLGAKNGQNFYFTLATQGPDMFYQIFNPDGTFLLDQMTSSQPYQGQLWQSGNHVVEVINRGNAPQSYNATFGID